MFLRMANQFRGSVQSFNMTPLIDIVFQLIIFFSLVCRFIEAENFPVAVPDKCKFAQSDTGRRAQATTVTVIKTTKGASVFAVGPEKITASGYPDMAGKLTVMIDSSLRDMPPGQRVVTLRIDKDVRFGEAQYALAGIAASGATDIQLAVLKHKRAGSERLRDQLVVPEF